MLFCGVSLHVFMTYYYPALYRSLFIECSFQVILLYSKCELYVKKNQKYFYKKAVKEVAETVSKQLNNKPATALKDYINPAVFSRWRQKSGV